MNIFPVPDGDTDIDMFLTRQPLVEATKKVTDSTVSAISAIAALHIASEQAYHVVANPVEGTILTVIREVTEAASYVNERYTSFT